MVNVIDFFKYLAPWEFSPTVLVVTMAFLAAYLRGWYKSRVSGVRVGFWHPLGFLVGVLSIYAALQTYFDYLSQHMFWVHRVQHLVLHHAGPFLIALSAPGEILALGAPRWIARLLRPLVANPVIQIIYRTVQRPAVASLLFVGLIYFWLTPSIHFYAMLSAPLYKAMNWSMAIDGLLFWWLIVGPERAGSPVRVGYGTRMIMLVAVALPQAVLGAYITFHHSALYDVYNLCGRAWPISPRIDQQLGGLNTWIPPGMMSALGLVIVASRWMESDVRVKPGAVTAPAVTVPVPAP